MIIKDSNVKKATIFYSSLVLFSTINSVRWDTIRIKETYTAAPLLKRRIIADMKIIKGEKLKWMPGEVKSECKSGKKLLGKCNYEIELERLSSYFHKNHVKRYKGKT